MPFLPPPSRFNIPDLPSADELLPFLRLVDEARWYSNFGPLVQELEICFQRMIRSAHGTDAVVPHFTTLVTGYHALAIGLKLLGVTSGDKVLVPALTFPACPLAVAHIGASATLADVDLKTWTLTPEIARAAAEKNRIKAVMPVALYGVPVPAEEWDAFTAETGIPVIIDAAAAIESQRYLKTGFVAHSLHALKPLGVGEGGLLASTNSDLIRAARQYSNFGGKERITIATGENAKMSEYHAAVALAQLKRWPSIKARRAELFAAYKDALKKYEAPVDLGPGLDTAIVSSLMLRLRAPEAPRLIESLNMEGVAAHHTYLPPLYYHPHLADLDVVDTTGYCVKDQDLEAKKRLMRNAESLNASVLGLPFHTFLMEGEIDNAVRLLVENIPSESRNVAYG